MILPPFCYLHFLFSNFFNLSFPWKRESIFLYSLVLVGTMHRAPTYFVYSISYCVLRLFPPHPNPLPRRREGTKILYLLIHSIHCILFNILVSGSWILFSLLYTIAYFFARYSILDMILFWLLSPVFLFSYYMLRAIRSTLFPLYYILYAKYYILIMLFTND